MSQTDELDPAYQGPVDAEFVREPSRTGPDWPVVVVALAFGCTLAWTSLLLWAVIRVFQMALE
jgi:hypothetical protein